MVSCNSLNPGIELQNGKYRIVSVLGQGGFGITYEAEQVNLGRRVAIKEFFMKDCCERDGETSHMSVPTQNNRALVDKFRGKFVKEAKMLASFEHPHIVRIVDVFEENGTAYYVMENLPGGSLADKVKKEGPMPENVAEGYIRQVADALSYIHGRYTVHLDVKPSNILLNAKGDAVLIDFGISKHYDQTGEQTSSTPVGISKGYAPLEQAQAGDVGMFTPATDIYALGATLYYLVTGTTPPEAAIVNEDGLDRPAGLSDRIWNAICSSMQPRRKDRPQDVTVFLSLIDAPVDREMDEEKTFVIPRKPANPVRDVNTAKESRNQALGHELPSPGKADRLPALLIVFLIAGLSVGAFAVFYLCINAFPWIATAGAIIGEAGLLLLLLKKKPGFIVFILGGVLCALSLCGSVSASAFWIALLVLSVVLLFLVMATFGFLQVKNKQGCSGWSLLRPLSSKSSLPKEQSGEKRYRYLLTQICIGIVLPFVLVILAEPGFRAMFFSVIKPFKVTGSIGGHDYVDLGLPSGLMWASCNMGADSPQDGGCFYSWGETITKDFYDYSNYSYSSKPDTLPLSDDVAYTEWGAYWRMPSREDLRELMDNCAFRFVKVKGVRGVKVISKKNGNWIFIPSAGWYMQNSLENKDVVASFWSSSDEPSRSDVVLHFSAYEGEPSISTSVPYWGNTVRPVTRLIPLNEQKISK